MNSFNSIMSLKTLFPNSVSFWDYWGLGLQNMNFGGDTIQPITVSTKMRYYSWNNKKSWNKREKGRTPSPCDSILFNTMTQNHLQLSPEPLAILIPCFGTYDTLGSVIDILVTCCRQIPTALPRWMSPEIFASSLACRWLLNSAWGLSAAHKNLLGKLSGETGPVEGVNIPKQQSLNKELMKKCSCFLMFCRARFKGFLQRPSKSLQQNGAPVA